MCVIRSPSRRTFTRGSLVHAWAWTGEDAALAGMKGLATACGKMRAWNRGWLSDAALPAGPNGTKALLMD
jgi:hypothetical protein